jgi:hypothetical protein
MYEITTKKSLKPGATFIVDIDGRELELTWKGHELIADGDPRQILGTWIEEDTRVFCCLEETESDCEYCVASIPVPTKEKGESEEHFTCRKTEAVISRHALGPAINGQHRILHICAAEGSSKFIPCRESATPFSVGEYDWQKNYEKAPPAQRV